MSRHPRAAVHPTRLLLAWALASYWLTRLWPVPFVPEWAETTLAAPPAIAGILLWVWGATELYRHDTSPDHDRPTTALVTSGPFRFSRNPLYLGLLLVMTGIALGYDSLWALILVVPTAVAIHRLTVVREEADLQQRFGDTYRGYLASSRRWL